MMSNHTHNNNPPTRRRSSNGGYSSNSSTTLFDLPQECKTNLFSFLPMKDVLTFGAASKLSLHDSLYDLNRRRQKLYQTFAYSAPTKTTRPGTGTRGSTHINALERVPSVLERVVELAHCIPQEHPMAPHVQELCHELVKHDDCIDCTIELQLHALIFLAPTTNSSGNNSSNHKMMDQDDDNENDNKVVIVLAPFTHLLAMLKRLSKPHKLHAYILNFVMADNPFVGSSPAATPASRLFGRTSGGQSQPARGRSLSIPNNNPHNNNNNNNNIHNNPPTNRTTSPNQNRNSIIANGSNSKNNTAVSLDRYLGDVLCLAFLLNQSCLQLVEGGPCDASCLYQQRRSATSGRNNQLHGYQSWIFMHSIILQCTPTNLLHDSFTHAASNYFRPAAAVGGGPTNNLNHPHHRPPHDRATAASANMYLPLLQQQQQQNHLLDHLPLLVDRGGGRGRGGAQRIPYDCYYITDTFLSSEMTLVFNDFGPPSHPERGRDVVHIRSMTAQQLFSLYVAVTTSTASTATTARRRRGRGNTNGMAEANRRRRHRHDDFENNLDDFDMMDDDDDDEDLRGGWEDAPPAGRFRHFLDDDEEEEQQERENWMMPGAAAAANINNNGPHHFTEGQQWALDWLLVVHEQCGKCRPMSVRPPAVRLSVPSS